MMRRRGAIAALLIAVSIVYSPIAARAEDCTLKRLASFDVAGLERDRVVVPIGIGETTYPFLIDTGSPYSVLSREIIREKGLTTESLAGLQLYNLAGKSFADAVHVPKIDINGIKAGPFWFVAGFPVRNSSPAFPGGAEQSGVLGADLLTAWDVELNLATKKLNLFLPDHCPGHVVYWSNDYTAIPIELDPGNHIVLPMKIDGEEIEGILDTGAARSTLSLASARHYFDLDTDSPGVQRVGNAYFGGASPVPVYRKQFHSLEIGDVTFKNPTIDLIEMSAPIADKAQLATPGFGMDRPRFILGVHELRLLRIYISYREHMLYVSAAEPSGVPQLN